MHKSLIEFQFQSGAVKRTNRINQSRKITVFQFQSGAVKRLKNDGTWGYATPFQFQSGAVKRKVFELGIYYERNFNSKVVRLKGGGADFLCRA